MTPDQYRLEVAEAMRAYIANGCDPSHLSRSDNPTEFHAGYRHAAIQRFTAIRAIDVDEVLARLSPATDAVARLVEAARAGLNYLENTEGEFGITLGCATGLRAALTAMETLK